MKFPLLEKLTTLRKRLAPVLKELEINAILKTENGCSMISFENADGTVYAPVALALTNDNGLKADTWGGSTLWMRHVIIEKISTNGWTCCMAVGGGAREIPEDATEDQVLSMLELEIRDMGVVFTGKHPTNTDCREFGELCVKLRDRLEWFGDPEMNFSRDSNGIESINCVDALGVDWRVTFHLKDQNVPNWFDILILKGGSEVARFDESDIDKAANYLVRGIERAFQNRYDIKLNEG